MTILNTSVSGMLADSNWLSSISQNVANANTTGYKNQETDFSTVVDAVSNTTPGGGVTTSLRSLNALQGNIVSSTTSTNLAVQGSGFFVVSDSSGDLYLTRNGSFVADASGNLVNSAGYTLMGSVVQNGSAPPANALSSLQKVNVSSSGETASPTTSASIAANLPSTATPIAAANLPSVNSATSTYHGPDLDRRLRQSWRSAHDQSLPGEHRRQHLGGRRLRRLDGLLRRRLPLFLRTVGDGRAHLQSDHRRTVLGFAALVHGSGRADDEPRSQQYDPACGRFQRQRGDRQRQRPGQPSGRLHRIERNNVI